MQPSRLEAVLPVCGAATRGYENGCCAAAPEVARTTKNDDLLLASVHLLVLHAGNCAMRGRTTPSSKCSDTASRTFSRSSSQLSPSVKMAWPSASVIAACLRVANLED